jgi:ABC-2 type transport system permease protein
MKVMQTLVRREFWEHRQLWIMPLVIAGLFIAVLALFPHANVQMDDSDFSTPHKQLASFAIFHSALAIPQFLLLAVLLPFYLLDCLYAERKDRSILFWKSLPVSDAQTVLSKLIVALAVVPLGVYVLTLVTDVAASGILAVRFRNSALLQNLLRWDTGVWLHTQGFILSALVVVMLWYAPLAAYLLLVSAWAKRNVTLWAMLPPLLAFVAERIAFHTNYVGRILGYRLNGIWSALGIEREFSGKTDAVGQKVSAAMGHISPLGVLQNIDLWLGLAATVALVWLTIRIRRRQSES